MARFTQGGGSGDGSALNYVQNKVSSPVSVTGWPTIIASLDITTTGKPVQISVTGEGANNQAGSWVRLNIFRDDQPIGNEIQIEASAVSENVPYAINVIDEVGSGLHTYQAVITNMSAGTWSFGEASGPILNAVELTGFKGDTGATGPQGEQGVQGEPGAAADIADFNFQLVTGPSDLSIITIDNHDMMIRTTRDDGQDADITINGADDVWIDAGHEIRLIAETNIILNGLTGVFINNHEDPDNQVATIGDIDESIANALGSATKTWTAPSEALYEIHQAHGGIEVQLAQPQSWGENVTIIGNVVNSNTITIGVSMEMDAVLTNMSNGTEYFRMLAMDIGPQTRYFRINNQVEPGIWVLYLPDSTITAYDQNTYYLQAYYGGAPALWWDADTLQIMPVGDEWKFRGAKIEYHAYSTDSGTIIGTIYIANDNGDNYVTHLETNSGVNDAGTVVLWNRSGNEKQLYAYRTDNEDDVVKIHWTAQVYYGTEFYD